MSSYCFRPLKDSTTRKNFSEISELNYLNWIQEVSEEKTKKMLLNAKVLAEVKNDLDRKLSHLWEWEEGKGGNF